MLLYNICKYTYYTYILLKNAPNPLIFAIVIMIAKSVDLYQVHLTFVIQYVMYTLIILYFEI